MTNIHTKCFVRIHAYSKTVKKKKTSCFSDLVYDVSSFPPGMACPAPIQTLQSQGPNLGTICTKTFPE